MNWRVRHQGSPVSIDDLTLAQVVEGLQDGQWEPTDEVIGPDDAGWVAIENHPELAEIAADLEPPPPRIYDDETRLDFNALIDVTLVLLIFFMLTTSYALLQKLTDAAIVTTDDKGVPVITEERVKEQMIYVTVTMENNQPVIRKTNLLIESAPDVSRQTLVAIQDKATGAKVQKIYRLVPRGG